MKTLKEYCKERGYTQSFIAHELGIKVPSVHAWFYGVVPRFKNLIRLSEFLGVDIKELIDMIRAGERRS